ASRRRNTGSYGDWSSDVCSSDLIGGRRIDHVGIYAGAGCLIPRARRMDEAARAGVDADVVDATRANAEKDEITRRQRNQGNRATSGRASCRARGEAGGEGRGTEV